MVEICTHEFDRWKRGEHDTIEHVNDAISVAIKSWLKTKLPAQVGTLASPVLADISSELVQDIKAIENRYGLTIGTLGGTLSLKALEQSLTGHSINLDKMDVTGGAAGALGNVIGVIVGVVAAVAAYTITPIVLGIALHIVAIVSVSLASAIFAILVSNPVGWAILAGIGIVAVAAGASAKEEFEKALPMMNLPSWVRGLVGAEKIHREIAAQRGEIYKRLVTAMEAEGKLRKQVVGEVTELIARRLKDAAEDARLLID